MYALGNNSNWANHPWYNVCMYDVSLCDQTTIYQREKHVTLVHLSLTWQALIGVRLHPFINHKLKDEYHNFLFIVVFFFDGISQIFFLVRATLGIFPILLSTQPLCTKEKSMTSVCIIHVIFWTLKNLKKKL